METNKKYYRVERKAIAFLRFIFEAYDGIATVTSIDPGAGTVMICIAPGCEAEVEGILDDLKKDMMIETRDGETIPFVP